MDKCISGYLSLNLRMIAAMIVAISNETTPTFESNKYRFV